MKTFKAAVLGLALFGAAPVVAEGNPWDKWASRGVMYNTVTEKIEVISVAYIYYSGKSEPELNISVPTRHGRSCESDHDTIEVMDVNGRPVNFHGYCLSDEETSTLLIMAESDAGMRHVVKEFKLKNTVNVGPVIYNAAGFTKAWNAAVADYSKRKVAL